MPETPKPSMDSLSPDEVELVRNYRKASPDDQRVIDRMVQMIMRNHTPEPPQK